jgi:hypothetical protein
VKAESPKKSQEKLETAIVPVPKSNDMDRAKSQELSPSIEVAKNSTEYSQLIALKVVSGNESGQPTVKRRFVPSLPQRAFENADHLQGHEDLINAITPTFDSSSPTAISKSPGSTSNHSNKDLHEDIPKAIAEASHGSQSSFKSAKSESSQTSKNNN